MVERPIFFGLLLANVLMICIGYSSIRSCSCRLLCGGPNATFGTLSTGNVIAFFIFISAYTILNAWWISACPPPQPRRIIPRPVIIKPALLIPLLPCITIPFRRLCLVTHRLIRRTPIRVIFLVRNDLSLLIQLQTGRSEVVAKLVAD